MFSIRSSLLSAVAALSVLAVTYQPAAAASASTYSVQGNVYRVVDYVASDSNEIRLNAVVKGPAANQPYAARVVPIKSSKVSSFFKPKLGALIRANAWWFAFMAVVESAGWAIDELKGQVVQVNASAAAGYYWVPQYAGSDFYASTPQAAVALFMDQYKNDPRAKLISVTAGATSGQFVFLNPARYYAEYAWGLERRKCSGAPSAHVPTCRADYKPVTDPVSDADFYAAVSAQMAADPAYAAQAFTDPATGKPYADLFDPVPYIPGLPAADEALVNCFISGQLQMVNSHTACYVATQAEYDRVKQQAEALASGRTPDASADALNRDLKQPITQAQYEESNKKYSDAVADVTASVSAQNDSDYSDIDENFNKLDGIITDLPNTTLPAPADISVPQYVDCQQLHLSDGNGHELDFPNASQCAKIETFKQGFGYFLAISVVFLLGMQLLTRPHG